MKNTLLKTVIIFASAIFVLSACGKYEEGPKFSLASKKARVVNKWKLEESFTNGEKDELDEDDRALRVEFTKDGAVTYSANGFALAGKWEFSDDKEELKISFNYGLGTEVSTYKILKLKSKEMWLEETDEDGDKYEIHYVSAN